jgi:hypothetical protein
LSVPFDLTLLSLGNYSGGGSLPLAPDHAPVVPPSAWSSATPSPGGKRPPSPHPVTKLNSQLKKNDYTVTVKKVIAKPGNAEKVKKVERFPKPGVFYVFSLQKMRHSAYEIIGVLIRVNSRISFLM